MTIRLNILAFAVIAALGILESPEVVANTEADVVYSFATSQLLAFSEAITEDKELTSEAFSFRPYLMPAEGYQTVVLVGVVDRTHTIVNENFNKLFYQIDDFFSNGQEVSRSNKSWARVRFDIVKSVAEDLRFKPSIKLRVVLPRTEKRFRLLFSTEDDESADRSGTQSPRDVATGDSGFSLALRFIRNARDKDLINFDLGARFRDSKAQIFGRVNLFFSHGMAWNFTSSFSNSFYYFSSSGYENRFRYNLTRPLGNSDTRVFRATTELLWAEDRNGIRFGETVGIYSEIDDNRSIAFEGLGFYTTELSDDQTDNFLGADIRIRFRHNIWRKWFFYEVWPTLSFDPVNDFSPSVGGLLRAEVVLGKF